MKKIEWQLYHNGDGSLTAACKDIVRQMQCYNADGKEIISWLKKHYDVTIRGRQGKFICAQLERIRLEREKR